MKTKKSERRLRFRASTLWIAQQKNGKLEGRMLALINLYLFPEVDLRLQI